MVAHVKSCALIPWCAAKDTLATNGECESYQCADAGTHVEDTPEPGPVPALALFNGIRHHDCTLSSP